MIVPADRVRLPATAGLIAVVLLLAVALLSVALSPAANWTVRTTLAGFCILAVARPDAALLVTSALVGFGIILAHLAGVPSLRVTEALVVACIAGCFVRAIPPDGSFRRALAGSISAPVVLFAVACVASSIVLQRVYLFETASSSAYFQALVRFVARDYFIEPGEFWVLVPAAVILEGLALYVCVVALCRVDETFFERTLRMLAVGGAGLGVLSVVRLAEVLLRNPDAIAAMRATSVGLRISPQIADYIAAGSYFALCWLVALGLAIASSQRRLVWLAAGLPLMAALYLTGSRSVIAAAVVGLAAPVAIVARQRAAARWIVVFAVVAVMAMVLGYQRMVGRDVVGQMARESIGVRVELLRAGLRVIETRPLFGVGIDQFYLQAKAVASPELRAQWTGRMNPHNDFLRFAAELGVVGLGFFVWILAAAARRTRHALMTTGDARLAGLAGGLLAFLVTSLVSNPLMVREVSYVFWIALGLAAGYPVPPARRSVAEAAAAGAAPSGPVSRWRRPIAVLLGAVLVLSIPSRARQELEAAHFREVSYGFFDWGVEADGTRFRSTGPRATLFVDPRAQLVEIPVRSEAPAALKQQVEVLVDGRLANRLAVGHEWQRLRTLLPATHAKGPRRIDLVVSPSWMPAEVIPGNEDRRVLGVKVGEMKVVVPSSGR